MGYVIWGAGRRGGNLYGYFQDDVEAFIESNPKKIGKKYFGKPVISFEDYRKKYAKDMIIISPADDEEILEILLQNEIFHFFRSNECPWEVVEMYEPEILENIENHIQRYINRKIYLIGLSIYGILVARILKLLGCNYLLISERKREPDFYTRIYEQEGVRISGMDCLSNGSDAKFLVVSGEKNHEITDKIMSDTWEDLFFLGKFLPKRFINTEICQFKNKHKNKRCFIVATGPSVRMEDLDILWRHHELCISMNKIFYSYDQTDWRPDYYVGEDVNLFRYYAAEIGRNVNAVKFLADTYEWDADIREKAFKYHVSFSDRNRRICGGEDFSEGYMCGYSVLAACLYLAMYMGFSSIYLIGADINYSNTFSDSNNHFYGDKDIIGRKNGKAYSPFYTDSVIESCEYILKMAKKKNVEIYNATRGGMLEVFPRAGFESLF